MIKYAGCVKRNGCSNRRKSLCRKEKSAFNSRTVTTDAIDISHTVGRSVLPLRYDRVTGRFHGRMANTTRSELKLRVYYARSSVYCRRVNTLRSAGAIERKLVLDPSRYRSSAAFTRMPQTSFPLRSSALAARPSDPDLLPRRVGQWDLTARVAKGRLANVYRVRPAEGAPDCPALYALKTLRPQWEDDPQAIRLLLREAVAGRSVSHPHVISILTASISRTPRFVVMPCLEGMNLR